MIKRYTRDTMKEIWSEKAKFQAYLDVELANVDALASLGKISKDDAMICRRDATFSLERIKTLENELKHDVVAFTRAVSETLGKEARYIHYGLTSTDVVDTAYGIRFKKVNTVIREDLDAFLHVLKEKAFTHKNTPCVGRTHGIHADITSFGLKFALWYEEMQRNITRFEQASKDVEVGMISGAVGNYAFVDPRIESLVCEQLGLEPATISTQVLQRDRHAHYMNVIALIGATLEKIATEIRHLQRTEVAEVNEHFSSTQKGSSAMPHKKNPVSSENTCGLARVLKGYQTTLMQNIALWHERDISHSSAERIVLPDATTLLDYMLNRMKRTIENLDVHKDAMEKNIRLTHKVIFSQRILHALIDKGHTREEAYDKVQPLAKEAYETHTDFETLVKKQGWFSSEDMQTLFSYQGYLTHVDMIFERVFK